MTITHSVLSGNVTPGISGGVYNDAGFIPAAVVGFGGGIHAAGALERLELQNTLLALNMVSAGGSGPDCARRFATTRPLTSLGNNLVGDSTDCPLTLLASDRTGDPGRGAFTDDGTPGDGHVALVPNSPAIDAGNDTVCPPVDQLGQARLDGQCDIGAIEFQATCPPASMPAQIASQFEHGCVIKPAATLWCWGEASHGRLGNGTQAPPQLTPIPIALTHVHQVEAGIHQACAVKDDGTAWCWGEGGHYKLGTGNLLGQERPRPVVTLTDVAEIATHGEFSCARQHDGTAWCWGEGYSGALGDGTARTQSRLVQVSKATGLTFIIQLAVSNQHTCAVHINGTVWCWGANGSGRLGDGTTIQRSRPTRVVGLSDMSQVVAGAHHSCALKSDGTVWCWGEDARGEVGDGAANTRQKLTPVQVVGLSQVTFLSAQVWHTCAVQADGTAWCWGATTPASWVTAPRRIATRRYRSAGLRGLPMFLLVTMRTVPFKTMAPPGVGARVAAGA